jgi:CHAT domain-containing protein
MVLSEEYLRKALAIEKKNGDKGPSYLATLHDLAFISANKGNLDDAEQYYREAAEVGRSMGPDVLDAAKWLAGLASVLVRKHQPQAAAELFEEAINSAEMEAAQLGGAETIRAGFRAERASYYLDYIDLLVVQGKPEHALQILERSRARTLLEMLEESHINVRASIPPDLLERQRLLHQKLDTAMHRQLQVLSSQHTQQQLASIHDEIEGLLRQYQQLEAEIRVSSPAYAALTQPRVLSVNEIQEQLLDAQTVLLEYSLGEKHSYLWAVTQDSVDCHELLNRAEIESAARQFYRLLTARSHKPHPQPTAKRPSGPTRDEDSLAVAAARLSRMILAPVQDRLNHKRLLIVADGALQYIPFAALPAPANQHGPGLPEAPLMAEHELVTLPSASVLASLRETGKRNQPSRTIAVLADPVFDAKDSRVSKHRRNISGKASGAFPQTGPLELAASRSAAKHLFRSAMDAELISSDLVSLPRLAFTRREANAILATVPPEEAMVALDFKASRALATSKELAQYRIIHFATHALMNSKHPELSGLVLSMVDEQGKAQNGFLQLEDIYNLTLPVDLVVLSACETGLGKEIHQEGLIGLTRGFMYAGASRVIASLWTVDDVATAELMGYLYEAMEKDRIPPADALRKAQLKMWQQRRWRHPYYWAAFQIQGEWK